MLVNSIRECEHYTTRSLTLKVHTFYTLLFLCSDAEKINVFVFPVCASDLCTCVCVCSVGIKPACCSITGTHHGPTTKPPTQRCRCCSWWPTLRQTDGRLPPWDRLSSTAGKDRRLFYYCWTMFETTPLPTLLCFQCRDWPDRLLHRHDDRLSTAAAGGSGRCSEHHLPAPSGQVTHTNTWSTVIVKTLYFNFLLIWSLK